MERGLGLTRELIMQLTYMGNSYTQKNSVQDKAPVELTYRRNVYNARLADATASTIHLTYRGNTYERYDASLAHRPPEQSGGFSCLIRSKTPLAWSESHKKPLALSPGVSSPYPSEYPDEHMVLGPVDVAIGTST